jgi:anti-sigma factor RsiW
VSASCGTVRERISPYLEDALTADERREFREHLASCPACRDRVAGVEPSLLFALAGPEEVSAEDVARVLAAVRTGVALVRTESRVGRARRGSRRRVAAMASVAALAAMTLVLPGSGRRPDDTFAAPLTASAPVAGADFAPAKGFSPASERAPLGMFPADATIYNWNPGAASQEPRVVWIVDRSLDI